MVRADGRAASTADVVAPDVGALVAELFGPAAREDPYPVYARLRAAGPVLAAPDGAAVVTSYAGVAAVMREHRLTKDPGRAVEAAGITRWREHPSLVLMFDSLLMINPPEHTRLRGLVAAAFTPRRVAALTPSVERIVADLLAAFDTADPVDVVAALAFPLPVTVIGELLGIPAADRPAFQTLVHDWTVVLEVLSGPALERADAAAVEIASYLDALAEERRARPTDDLISALVAVEGDGLSRTELVTVAALLLAAGFETTTGMLSNGVVALLEHPDQLAWLHEHPAAAEAATTELLRFDSPTQLLFGRTAPTDLQAGPVALRAGQRVLSLIGSANRDPRVWADPDVLRLDREGPPPLSFGGGIHYCLGAPLARLEVGVALRELVGRHPRLALAGAPERRPTLALRGHARLPVTTR